MKFKGHFVWTTLYLFLWCLLLEPTSYVLIIIVAFISTMPDIDLKIFPESHRNVWTHSLLFPILALIFYSNTLTLLILLAFGHHLALDTIGNLIFGKKATGYYTICLWPSFTFNFYFFKLKTRSIRLSGKLTTTYLLSSWVISIIIAVVVIVYI